MAEKTTLLIDEDVGRGLREVSAEVAAHRGGLFVGRGPGGFCVIAGAFGPGVLQVGNGSVVAVAANEATLRALRTRIDSLLGEHTQAPLPEGLVLG